MKLRALAGDGARRREAAQEHCELCGRPVPPEHRHVLRLEDRELLCTCRPCATLFSSAAASAGRLRLVPERRLRLEGEVIADEAWESLRLPVELAFLFHHTAAGRVGAYYPSPMGPTESLLPLDTWREIEAATPVLGTLEPDVEALLINRARGARGHWLVPIDDCYALVGLIRTRWRGLTGGRDVWEGIAEFFERLDRRARPVGGKELAWRT